MYRKQFIGLLLLLFFPLSLFGQITITPTSIFLDQNSRIGNMMVINNSDDAQEITLDFVYGYLESYEDGSVELLMENDEEDEITDTSYSLSEYIRGFPQSFTLNPGQRQSVRLFVNPPADLEDGTYWTRILVGSAAESPAVGTASTTDITANINITLNQNLGLFYKNGDVSTGIEVENITSTRTESGINTLVKYNRTGNSPFIGTVTTRVMQRDEVISTNRRSTTLFFGGTYAVENEIENLEPGDYRVEVSFVAERNDIASENLVSMSPVSQSVQIAVE